MSESGRMIVSHTASNATRVVPFITQQRRALWLLSKEARSYQLGRLNPWL
jgi:hypothetical protein